MHAIPFAYTARNLWVRRVATLLTAGGMTLVMFVFATVPVMSEEIRATLVATGQGDNVLLLREGAGAQINSGVTREQAAIVETLPGIASDGLGRKRVSRRSSPAVPRREASREWMSASRCALPGATGSSSAFSMPAAAPSTARSGAMPSMEF